MKAESNIVQPHYIVEPMPNGMARVTLFTNQAEIESENGTHYVYDKYVSTCINRPGLGVAISGALDAWITALSTAERCEIATAAREARDRLLANTDYIMCADYPASTEVKTAIQTYRQALRDVPEQEGFPYAIYWPQKPEV